MSSFQQPCPSCQATLQLPNEAIGKSARCPNCRTEFPILGPVIPPAAAAMPQGVHQLPAFNPYAPSNDVNSAMRIGSLELHQVSIEPILGTTWAIMQSSFGKLILITLAVGLPSLVVMFVILALMFGTVALFSGQASSGRLAGAISILVLVPLLVVLVAYAWTAYTRGILAVARNHPVQPSTLLPPLLLIGKVLLSGLIVGFSTMVVLSVLAALVGIVAGMLDPRVLAILTGGGMLAVQFLSQFAFQFLLWPWLYLLCDDRSGPLDAISDAIRVSMHNKLITFCLVILSMVLSFAGQLACLVGTVVTLPASTLLMAVAYLMITNREVADPRMARVTS